MSSPKPSSWCREKGLPEGWYLAGVAVEEAWSLEATELGQPNNMPLDFRETERISAQILPRLLHGCRQCMHGHGPKRKGDLKTAA